MMATVPRPRASEAQRAIRASRALRARRDFGLAAGEGNVAAWWQWAAKERHAGPQRRGLAPLAVLETIFWAALFELVAPEEAPPCPW